MPRLRHIVLAVICLFITGLFVVAQDGNANVIDMAESLNIRSAPSGRADIVGEVAGNAPINVIGRNASNRWYQITTIDGAVTGWVAASFVDLRVARADIPIVNAETPASTTSTTTTTTTTSAPAPAPVDGAIGTVNVVAANVRASASTRAAIIAELPRGTQVGVIARNASSTWIQVQLDGATGWIFASLLDLNVSVSSLPSSSASNINSTVPTTDDSVTTDTTVTVAVPAGDAPYFTLGASASNIFATGQELGRRANVFSKIGDSITVDEQAFGPLGFGVYNLGDFDYLRPTVSFFSAQARDNNSFNNTSLAAGNGYTTRTILDSNFANNQVCNSGESPLACEYRTTNPAVALILLGTNDTTNVPIDEFRENMFTIADFSIAEGVIPVLTTIPPRLSFPGRAEAYNQVIINVAQTRGLPLIDLYSAIVVLPDGGMNPDGIHPSSPPTGFEGAGDFRGNNLSYGYTIRNLTALQALHVLRTSVLQ
ncbi:MAG: SH3 domain-containing protein [Chloroflexota bacterium]